MWRNLWAVGAVAIVAVGLAWMAARATTLPAIPVVQAALAQTAEAQDTVTAEPNTDSTAAPSGSEAALPQAYATSTQQRYQAEAGRYAAILAASPGNQEAALNLARCHDQAGDLSSAVVEYEAVVQIDPWSDWALKALGFKAQACRATGNTTEAQRCVDLLKARFPDSTEAARGALLAVQIAGGDTGQAAAILAREMEAAVVYDEAAQAADSKDDARALQLLEGLITQYPGTPAWLRAQNKKGHILIRNARRDEARASFAAILNQVSQSAPGSRVALTAQTRLAALYHSAGQREQALATYQDLLSKAGGSPFAVNAGLQVAGLEFEFLHRNVAKRLPIGDDRWQQLRSSCSNVIRMAVAKPEERVRAHLMMIETFSWQGQPEETIAEADRFLQTYTDEAFKQEIATARFFAGEELMKLGRYAEALAQFRAIIAAYQGQREIWPRMDHLPRTYFRIWEALERSKAPEAEIREAAGALAASFPESSYAMVVQAIVQKEEK